MLVAITRLRIAKLRYLPRFMKLSRGAILQATEDPTCLRGATYFGPGLTFWTVTVWTDEKAMGQYLRTGAHKETLPWLARLCSDAATGHFWEEDGGAENGTGVGTKTASDAETKIARGEKPALPTKSELYDRLLAAGPKFFKLQTPSPNQEAKMIPGSAPWSSQIFK